jgi:hypothetical protein
LNFIVNYLGQKSLTARVAKEIRQGQRTTVGFFFFAIFAVSFASFAVKLFLAFQPAEKA